MVIQTSSQNHNIREKLSYNSVQHIPVNVCASEHLGVPTIYQLMSTVIHYHIGSTFGNNCCLFQCFPYCLKLSSCVHSLHVLDVCTRGNEDFVFRISLFSQQHVMSHPVHPIKTRQCGPYGDISSVPYTIHVNIHIPHYGCRIGPYNEFFQRYIYTLGKKGCYTPIEDNKTNVDRTFVFPLGWNWHDMDPWVFPNEIRHYLGQTFNARSSGIVEFRNHSISGRSPKSIFILWQLWINICILFQKFFWLFEQCPVQPLWVLGMGCLHLPVRALSKVLLLPVWIWLVLPSTAYSKGMLPLDRWCQASLQGLPERQHLGKTVHCWGWSDRIVSWVLGP